MSRPPDMYRVSEAPSKVMDDIGVNERLVMKRRRLNLLIETIIQLAPHNLGRNRTSYFFGSQTEGSTTMGLCSDADVLISDNRMNVIQTMSEWKPGFSNSMMIQNENISPGYCYLHAIRPLDENVHYVTGSEGGLLWNHTGIMMNVPNKDLFQKHGPALTHPGMPGYFQTDIVYSFYCNSSPHQVTSWLQKHRGSKWPTENVLDKCRNAGCFVVPVASKVHSPDILESELEWRISTSLQERYLMFSLNIPQLMCYILMKMILKTHINPYVPDVLTSFMCKNVLLYCIANSSHNWHAGTLLSYLHLCLFMLKECIAQRNCPHFIIPENNLLAGHMSDTQRGILLDIINSLIENNEFLLFEIQTDDLGRRLKMKLNMVPHSSNIQSATDMSLVTSACLVYTVAESQSGYFKQVLYDIKHASIEMALLSLSQTCSTLAQCRNKGDLLQNTACDLLTPMVSSALGSVLACVHIDHQTPISDQAFTYLEAGKESDALSGRLKLVSVLYCTGDMERAERELTIILIKYNLSEVHTLCGCHHMRALSGMKIGGKDNFENYDEKAIKSNIALCTKFLQCENNCVPHELRYEMLRSYIEEDRQIRTSDDTWMDLITVDSIPYLFYLQYKTYGHLQRRKEQIQALHNLLASVKFEPNIQHKETALNLLGQCLEQEDMQTEAFQCYIESLKYRRRNNAAVFLLCIQLFKLQK